MRRIAVTSTPASATTISTSSTSRTALSTGSIVAPVWHHDRMPMRPATAAALLVVAACGGAGQPAEPAPNTSTTVTTTPAPTVLATTTTEPPPGPVVVRYRIERHADDDATADFDEVVRTTLEDARGWQRAGFDLVEDPGADYVVVLGEAAEVDALCLPMDTYGLYSCQNGPVVALNADRWRTATPKWTGDLATYRQMLVNHEVGHLLGRHHPDIQCPAPGRPAPVMAQQSTELDGCLPNPWPLDSEIAAAARHDRPLAPL